MSRCIKRVPLNFSWPINKVWAGYINPYPAQECEHCNGTGYSKYARKLKERWYGRDKKFTPESNGSVPYFYDDPVIMRLAARNLLQYENRVSESEYSELMFSESIRLSHLFNSSWSYHVNAEDISALIASDRLTEFTHVWSEGKWNKKSPDYTPTPKEINEWNIESMGHDSINVHVIVRYYCNKKGKSQECKHCRGDGYGYFDKFSKELSDDWKPYEPPTGVGYQVWETTSEGSPISPVFETPELLASHMASDKINYESWLKFISSETGWAPTFVIRNGAVYSGVEYITSI